MNSYEIARYNAGLSVKDAAARASVHPRTIRRLENDEIPQASAPVAKALADVYGIPVAQLLGVSDDGSEPKAAA